MYYGSVWIRVVATQIAINGKVVVYQNNIHAMLNNNIITMMFTIKEHSPGGYVSCGTSKQEISHSCSPDYKILLSKLSDQNIHSSVMHQLVSQTF